MQPHFTAMTTGPPVRDVYDLMPPDVGPAQRRHNQERLALLEADGDARRARIALVVKAAEAGAGS
jgi:hypothetical protein